MSPDDDSIPSIDPFSLEMELDTAVCTRDIPRCRELLHTWSHTLRSIPDHHLVFLMDEAIKAGPAADPLLTLLLDAGAPANAVDDYLGPDYQHTPLVTAARLGRLDLIKKLVAAGADPLWSSPIGTTALSEIIPSSAPQAPLLDSTAINEVRLWLTQQGLTINPLCTDSQRKLFWASAQPASWPDIPALLAIGIPLSATGWSPFMLKLASGTATTDDVATLSSDDLSLRDEWDRTPFLLAITAGNLAIASALLDHGSNLHDTGYRETSALHIAAKHNHCHLIPWLLGKGLPLHSEDESGHSPLNSAVIGNCTEAARLLLELGANPRECSRNGFSLIHDVRFSPDLAMLKLLLDAGADINAVSGGGSWPLHSACERGNAAAVAFLLNAGADPDLTSTGETALFAAVASDCIDCVQLLLDAGATVHASDADYSGRSCLFNLLSESIALRLLEKGANPGAADECGILPEDWERIPLPVRHLLRTHRLAHKAVPPSQPLPPS
jgi:ankyrin repeat protein